MAKRKLSLIIVIDHSDGGQGTEVIYEFPLPRFSSGSKGDGELNEMVNKMLPTLKYIINNNLQDILNEQ
jgi:hypothetical protein